MQNVRGFGAFLGFKNSVVWTFHGGIVRKKLFRNDLGDGVRRPSRPPSMTSLPQNCRISSRRVGQCELGIMVDVFVRVWCQFQRRAREAQSRDVAQFL